MVPQDSTQQKPLASLSAVSYMRLKTEIETLNLQQIFDQTEMAGVVNTAKPRRYHNWEYQNIPTIQSAKPPLTRSSSAVFSNPSRQ